MAAQLEELLGAPEKLALLPPRTAAPVAAAQAPADRPAPMMTEAGDDFIPLAQQRAPRERKQAFHLG